MRTLACAVLSGALCLLFVGPAVSSAQAAAPQWTITSVSNPTVFPVHAEGLNYTVTATNTGSAATDGSTVTVADTLPAGLRATSVSAEDVFAGAPLACEPLPALSCHTSAPLDVGDQIVLTIGIATKLGAPPSVENSATVSGGGAPDATAPAVPTQISSSPASFGIAPGSFFALPSSPQAGAHPNFTTSFAFDSASPYRPAGAVRDVSVRLPAGLIGNPTATPRCTMAAVTASTCPPDTALGDVVLSFDNAREGQEGTSHGAALLYNIAPYPDEPAALAFSVSGVTTRIDASFGPDGPGGAYRIATASSTISEALRTAGVTVTVWGVPADHNGPGPDKAGENSTFGRPSGSARLPFFTNPTSCDGAPLATDLSTDSWQQPGSFAAATAPGPVLSGCDRLAFEPSFALALNPSFADSPAGTAFDLQVPQNPDPNAFATPALRDTTVALPRGLTLNPSTADGLAACTPAQIDLASAAAGSCPEASQIATVELHTPLLEEAVSGHLYLGAPECSPCAAADAESGRMLHGYLEAAAAGVVVKVPGAFRVDPATGQILASFLETPQVPFSDLSLTFKGGARGSLASPETCGTYTTTADFRPWSAPDSGPDATASSDFQITAGPGGSACANTPAQRPLHPKLEAGTISPIAGSFSPFLVRFVREDGEQELSTVKATLPPGLLGKLAGVGECSDAALAQAAATSGAAEKANPSCPAASKIGSVVVGAGSGSHPFYISGSAYLAGPYKGAPLSMAVVTPALAGPFDLGTVVVRAGLYVNPETAQITVKSDPLPQSLAGIPLKLRDVRFNVDRPEFTINPTSCQPFAIGLSVGGSSGATDNVDQRFQIGACQGLPFAPRIRARLIGPTHRGQFPSLQAVLTAHSGEANIARVITTLPRSEFLEQGHIGTVCTRVAFAEGAHPGERCPAASVYGFAKAESPLLEKPLEGPAYLRSSSHQLPDLVIALHGQIDVVLDGRIDTGKGGGIRNSFETVPDAPVSRFVLTMQGGRKGLLVNSTDLCEHRHFDSNLITGQNGKTANQSTALAVRCPRHAKRGKRHHRRA